MTKAFHGTTPPASCICCNTTSGLRLSRRNLLTGGAATLAKLDAARTLGIEVFMINRPQSADVPTFETLDALLEFLETLRHRKAP